MILESNYPFINHIMFLRRTFPYLDYYNKFLIQLNMEEPAFSLKAMFYSDTTNMAFQILSQNSRMLKSTQGQKTLNADQMRVKAIFMAVVAVKGIVSENPKRVLAEKLVSIPPKSIFDLYKLLGFYLEWMSNNPTNLPILRFIKTAIDQMHEQISSSPSKPITPETMENIKVIMGGNCIIHEESYRHELMSMNDYSRKNDKIVSAAIDDEMVVIEMKAFFKDQLRWLESKVG